MAYSYDKVLAPVSQADLHLASVISLHVHGKLTLLLLSKQFAVDVSPRELTSRSAQEAGLRNEYIPILLMVMLFWWWSLCLLNVAKLGGALVVGAHPSRIGRRRGIVVSASDCEPAEGDVVLYRNDPESDEELSFGVVVADMGCTQWLQPLISKDVVAESNEQLVLFEEGVDDVMVQGGCVAVVDAMWGQLPIPSLGGGTGYNSPPVSSWTVKAADLPLPLSEIEIKVVEGGLAPWCH